MPNGVHRIIDSDGHIIEKDKYLYPYLEKKYPRDGLENYPLFPTLDGFRRANSRIRPGFDDDGNDYTADAQGWLRFLDRLEISEAVLYPTAGLGSGFSKDVEWAIDLCAAYNNYLSDYFLKKNSRFMAVALLPVQQPNAAAKELHRAVTELGFVAGLLPVPGLRLPYGDRYFDPIYDRAQALDVPLAVHGAAQTGVGIDLLSEFDESTVLAHPIGQFIHFTDMLYGRVFDRFPNLTVVYQEAGAGWVPYLMERIDRNSESRSLASDTVANHAIYFHAELEERDSLRTALSVVGDDRFVYASDFPHEPTTEISEALAAFLAREDISLANKQKILSDNVKALYRLE
jgi:uncharacterized protein